MKKFRILATVLFTSLLLISCGGGGGGAPASFALIDSYPNDADSDGYVLCIPTDTNIVATFNRSVDLATLDNTTFMVQDCTVATAPCVDVLGTYSLDVVDDKIAIFDPTNILLTMPYDVTLTAGVLDSQGNPLTGTPVNWRFTPSASPPKPFMEYDFQTCAEVCTANASPTFFGCACDAGYVAGFNNDCVLAP